MPPCGRDVVGVVLLHQLDRALHDPTERRWRPTNMWCASSFSMNSHVRDSGSNALSRSDASWNLPSRSVKYVKKKNDSQSGVGFVERAEDARVVDVARVPLEHLVGLVAAVAAEVAVQQVHHRPEVAALFDVDLEEVAHVVQARCGEAQVALLLHRRRLGVALHDDQPAEVGPVLAGHLLPDRFAQFVAERDSPVGLGRRRGRCPTGSRAS